MSEKKLIVKLVADVADLRNKLATASKDVNSFSGRLSSALKVGLAGFGIVSIFSKITSGVGNAIREIAGFERQMSQVKAVSNATGKDFDALRNSALELGRSTKFTATQAGELQTEFAKLGFTAREIVNVSRATLALASAAGTDLATAARVAGGTLRAFGLDSSKMGKVVDVMAKSFSSSALDISNFEESIKFVGPVAASSGISLAETTALLAVLSNSMIRGSQAGTGLRRIIVDLTKDGGTLNERLEKLAEKGLSVQDSFDEVGRIAQTALLVLTKNASQIKLLSEVFDKVNGDAEAMAKTMEDNLTGDVTKLTSAFSGLILKGSGISEFFRQIVQDATTFINISQLIPGVIDRIKGGNIKDKDLDLILSITAPDKVKPIQALDNDTFFNNIADNREKFIGLLLDEGRSLNVVLALWNRVVALRVESAKQAKEESAAQRKKAVADEIIAAGQRLATAQEKKRLAQKEERLAQEERNRNRAGINDSGLSENSSNFNRIRRIESVFPDTSATLATIDAFRAKQNLLANDLSVTTTEAQSMAGAIQSVEEKVLSANVAMAANNTLKMRDDFLQMGNAAADLGSTLGSAFADLADGTASAVQVIAAGAESILNSLEKIVLAKLVSKAIDSGFGFGTIALAAAAFAAGKALFRKIRGSGGGGGGGGASGGAQQLTPVIVQQGERLSLSGEFRVSGSDLVAVLTNQNRRDSVIRG